MNKWINEKEKSNKKKTKHFENTNTKNIETE